MEDRRKFFKKSLSLLEKADPSLAYQLKMTDPSDLEFSKTAQNELNLQRCYENQIYYYHSPKDALKEAEEWFQSLDLHSATVIFVYGVGLGYYYLAAKSWLKTHPRHSLVFLEEDLGVLHRLCETEIGLELFKNSQVKIVYFRNLIEDKPIFNELTWTYFENSFVISNLKLYEKVNPEGSLELHRQLSYYFERKRFFIEEYLQCGVAFFRNFYSNILELPHAYQGNGLFQRFSQVPAIICGAGPSLSKNMHLLAGLKDRALLFAGGSALNALIPQKIFPHFCVAIDPHISQYSRVAAAQPHRLPFFYRNRLFHQALEAITGPRLYLTGAGGYDTARWFESELNIQGEDLEEGHNVVNFSIEIAKALGCNPIILVGVDLAFTNQKYYAEGITADLNVKEEDLLKTEALPITRQDMNGKPISTLWKWVIEAEWISEFAESHPEITFINATEGGLGFKNIPNLSLEEASQKFLKNQKEEIRLIDQEIQKHALKHIRFEQILKLLQKLMESLHQCSILYAKLIQENEELTEKIRQQGSTLSNIPTSSTIALEGQIEGEIGYQYLLNMFDQIHIHLYHREMQDLQSPKQRSKKKWALKTLEFQKRRLIFLHRVAQFNRSLIQQTIEEKKKSQA